MSHVERTCPLCATSGAPAYFEDATRRYARCGECDLIFVFPEDRPRPLEEVIRYLQHENDSADAGYATFLAQLADPLCEVVPHGARGLDYGSGPSPVLAEMLTARGRPTEAYDPLFKADAGLLAETYDFVTCSEVVEHAHDPRALFATLASLLKPAGVLGVMTRLHDADTNFETWWYRRDITHVCFYSVATMRWLAEHRGWQLSVPAINVGLFHAGSARSASIP